MALFYFWGMLFFVCPSAFVLADCNFMPPVASNVDEVQLSIFVDVCVALGKHFSDEIQVLDTVHMDVTSQVHSLPKLSF